jgi:hypothetical protein
MAKVFISHRGGDAIVAEHLASKISLAGHEVWLDAWELNVGDSLVEKISGGLSEADYVVLCCSQAGTSAPWMSREWMSTLARQLAGVNTKLLPALLSGGEAPEIIADYKYADLAADFDRGVAELLAGMK